MHRGASLITIYFRTLADQWSKAEEIWEGLFSLFGSFLILVMALAMLRMDRAKEKWKTKLDGAFSGHNGQRGMSNFLSFLSVSILMFDLSV